MGVHVGRAFSSDKPAQPAAPVEQVTVTSSVTSSVTSDPAARPSIPRRRPVATTRKCVVVFTKGGPSVTRVYKVFGLRQGTMMIAVHDLMWSAFLVFLLVLAAAHTREVAHLVEDELQAQAMARSSKALSTEHRLHRGPPPEALAGLSAPEYKAAILKWLDDHAMLVNAPAANPISPEQNATSMEAAGRLDQRRQQQQAGSATASKDAHRRGAGHGAGGHGCVHHGHHDGADAANRSYYMRYVEFAFNQAKSIINTGYNSNKLNNGLHFATMMTMLMVFGLCMAGVDMIASMMLLAGAMLSVRQLMMPWLSLRLIELMLILGSTFLSVFYFAKGLFFWKIFIVDLLLFSVVFYHWLVAFSLHERLCRIERTGLIHTTRPAGPGTGAGTGGQSCTCIRPNNNHPQHSSAGAATDPMQARFVGTGVPAGENRYRPEAFHSFRMFGPGDVEVSGADQNLIQGQPAGVDTTTTTPPPPPTHLFKNDALATPAATAAPQEG